MTRVTYFAFGVLCHLLFLGVYAWMAAFFGNFPWLAKTIDSPPEMALGGALAIDAGLVLLFALQHSVMARPWFKQWWTQIVPEPIERSTYVLFSCLALAALLWLWQPLGGVVWDLSAGPARWIAWTCFALGWFMVPAVTFMINHWDLFGLRQVWLHWQGEKYQPLPFSTPGLYQAMRHPLYVGWTIAFWSTPTMTVGHLVLAVLLTGYMLVAVVFEERDLVAHFGRAYEEYQRRVPMFLPNLFGAAEPENEPQPVSLETLSVHETLRGEYSLKTLMARSK